MRVDIAAPSVASAPSMAIRATTRWGRALAIFAFAASIGCVLIWVRAEQVAARVLAHQQMAEFTAAVETVQPLPAQQMTRLVVRPQDNALPPRIRINVAQ